MRSTAGFAEPPAAIPTTAAVPVPSSERRPILRTDHVRRQKVVANRPAATFPTLKLLPSEVPESIRQELAALATKPEHDIDCSDVPATTAHDWQGARRGQFYRPAKKPSTVRIDADGLEWLKSQGKGDRRRPNAIPRATLFDQKS